MIAPDHPARLTTLALELGRLGDDITIHARRVSPLKRRTTLAPGVAVEYLPAGPEHPVDGAQLLPHLGEFGRRLAARWGDRPPEVVHAHGWTGGLAALAGSQSHGSARTPVLQSFELLDCRCGPRGPASPPKRANRGAQARLERALGRTAVASTVACTQDKDALIRLGVPRNRISVVPGAVDIGKFTTREPAYPRGEQTRLLMTTGPVPEGGAGAVVRALAGVPGAELVIAGGPEPASLETDPGAGRLRLLAKEAGVDDRVILLGKVPARVAPRLIRSADLMLALGPYDPYGTAALEAMACGVPVMATRAGGHLDTVLDGVTGLLISDLTPSGIARRLRASLADPTLLQALGIAGADRVRARHSWPRIAAETHRLYEEITC
ncbi:glycosyl transferase [Actinomadura sp. NBRC 104412]|uniref:glycosyltransferase n=1 Tax=Actinomadura sp. NBRC 104412 TaxID=3032203 RepID=UPI0024A54818|nr:glycosyltransferase [Actinomadura sp. NBRC 104412]GLZ09712.1 glycosyl transferase [Actinomadura sp. NBRC 104412]